MNTCGQTARFARPRTDKQILVSLLASVLTLGACPQTVLASQDSEAPAQTSQAPPRAQQTPEQLQRLVAPIALYPDPLVAQILAASTYPEQVVEADRWLQAHPDLKGEAFGQAVDQQSWDPSVMALTAFPSVLGNLDKNLSWTSALGDAYYNQEQDVIDAVQVMRGRAQESGNLKTTAQQTVTTQGSTIIVEPAAPDVVYIPAYDPWVVYGDPIVAWPGWYPYPGIWYDGPYPWFGGVGFGIGWFGGWGWGWGHWGCDWHDHHVIHDHQRYYSRSNTFYNRNDFYRERDERGRVSGGRGELHENHGARDRAGSGVVAGRSEFENRSGATAKPFNGDPQAARGYADPHGQSGVRSGAFSGYDHGGQERSFSQRGGASFGGGGFHSGGGGGFHGAGGRH